MVACGKGVPGGSATFVITCPEGSWKRKEAIRVWSPLDGLSFSILDPFCPLTRISFLFNGSDVWANIQDDMPLSRLALDIRNASCWSSLNAGVKASNKHHKSTQDLKASSDFELPLTDTVNRQVVTNL